MNQIKLFELKSLSFHKDTIQTKQGLDVSISQDSTYDLISINWSVHNNNSHSEYLFYISKKSKQILSARFNFIISPDPRAEKFVKNQAKNEYQIFSNGKLVSVLDIDKKKIELTQEELNKLEQDTKHFLCEHLPEIEKCK